jgi:hypothetical protein
MPLWEQGGEKILFFRDMPPITDQSVEIFTVLYCQLGALP